MTIIDSKKIIEKIGYKKIVQEVEKAYVKLSEGQVVLPERQFMPTYNSGDLLLGGSYIKGSGFFGAKLSAWQPGNVKQPKVNGVYALFNEITGTVAAIMDCESVTKARTGAKTAVALKYLAPLKPLTVGIIGMGNQAESHARAIASVLKVERFQFWTRNPQDHKGFLELIQRKTGVECQFKPKEEIAASSNILINTADAFVPLYDSNVIKSDTIVIGINHSPKAVDFDARLFKRCSKVFVDFKQNKDAGTLQNAIKKGYIKEDKIIELSEFVGKEKYRIKKGQIYYFQSGGVSIEDLAGAIAVYKNQ